MTEEEEVKVGKRWPTEAELANDAQLEIDDSDRVVDLQGGPGKVSKNEAPFAVEDNDTGSYVGVSPEYMTYANDTERPMRAGGGVEKDLEDEILGQERIVTKVEAVDGNQTQGGGSRFETVTTATSGRDYSSKVASVIPDKAKVTADRPAKKSLPARPSAPSRQQ